MFENSPIAAILSFFIVLIPLILIHELGHFLAAKAVGITILEFGLGFPPKIRRLFTWKETEFTLNWIPLGGFVRPLGEDVIRPLAEEQVNEDRAEVLKRYQPGDSSESPSPLPIRLKSVNEASPIARIVFMSAGAIANFLLALFVFVIVALIGTPQVTGSGVGIIAVEPNSVFANVGLENGDIIIEVNGEKFETVQEVLEAYYRSKSEVVLSVQKRETGDLLDIVVPPSDQGTQLALTSFVQIQQVVSGSPADKAGMKPGDLVFAFDATPIDSVDEFRIKTKENTGREITLSIQRESQNFKITLTPRENPPEGQGAMGVVISSNIVQHDSNVGLTFLAVGRIEYVPLPLNQALRYSGDRVSSVIVNTVRIPGQLISGAISPQEARPVSVLGMSQIGAVFLQESIEQKRVTPILEFIATISVALGFFNLLPIPALHGGRIVFVLVEIVRGKPITAEREGLVHLIGLALLLSLSVLIFINDLIHPVIDQIR